MSTAALVPVPRKSLNLFECVEEVEILLDCAETVTPAQQEEYRRDLALSMTQLTTKIDRVHGFMKHCQANAKAAAEEIKRLQGVKKQYENAEQSMRDAVLTVLENVVQPDKNGRRQLKSQLVTFSLRGNPAKVEIRNEELIPSRFKTITVELPLDTWNQIMDRYRNAGAIAFVLHDAEATAAIAVDGSSVQDAIESAIAEAEEIGAFTPEDLAVALEDARKSVPGAYLSANGKNSVVIR